MLRVIGAGNARTGTMSLKLALERLLDAPCYHMIDLWEGPGHISIWHAAVRGEPVPWATLFSGFAAAVDWPASLFWNEIRAAFPDAVVLLSERLDADQWWRSASRTIVPLYEAEPEGDEEVAWSAMMMDLLDSRFTPDWRDASSAMAAYDRHNDEVRRAVATEDLIVWHPEDGWGPLCEGLRMQIPAEPFPSANSTEEFRRRTGLESGPP
jgi:hypothetical protein